VKQTVEREVKLEPGEGFVLPELGGEARPTRVFVSTYHDTDDLVLAGHGITLRRRVEDGAGLWQLKLPHGSARLELEHAGPPARPPLELASLLVAYLRGRELRPVARLRTRREVVRTAGAEIVDDAVSVLDGQRVVRRFRELEVELIDGDEEALARISRELERAGATTRRDLRPKLFRALDLPVSAHRPATPAREGARPLEVLGAALDVQAQRLLEHDPGVRLGSEPEELHQLRVATRRLRAFLRAGRDLLESGWAASLRDELGWLGRALGPARDLDVLIERLAADADELGEPRAGVQGLLAELGRERAEARAVLLEALTSDRYLALLDRLDHIAAPPPSGAEVPLADVWRTEWERTRKAVGALGRGSPDAELHAARIRVKRARYAAELAAPELGKRGAAFVDAAKALQDVLGEHQDAAVAEERIRAWVAAGGDELVASRLLEREEQRKEAARASWPAAWKALRRAAKPLA